MPTPHEGAAIVDPHDNAAAVAHPNKRSKRQSAVSRGHCRTVETFSVGGATAAQAVTTGLWTGLTLSAALALGEAWLGITLAYYTDWPVSFCIAVLSAAAYFGSIMTPPWRGGSKVESIPKQQIP